MTDVCVNISGTDPFPVTWANTRPAVEKRIPEYKPRGKPTRERTSSKGLVSSRVCAMGPQGTRKGGRHISCPQGPSRQRGQGEERAIGWRKRKWRSKCPLTSGVEWGQLECLWQALVHVGELRGIGRRVYLHAAAWTPRRDVLAKESNVGLQSPWVSFVTVTNRQGRQSSHSRAHPCRRITRPQLMRQAHWHLGFFPPEAEAI